MYSFDSVGSYQRDSYKAGGSASAMLQPLLDNQVSTLRAVAAPLPCLSSPRWPVGTGTEGSLENRGGSPAVALAPSLLHPDFEVPSAGSSQSSWHLHLRILKTPSTHNTVSLSPNFVF